MLTVAHFMLTLLWARSSSMWHHSCCCDCQCCCQFVMTGVTSTTASSLVKVQQFRVDWAPFCGSSPSLGWAAGKSSVPALLPVCQRSWVPGCKQTGPPLAQTPCWSQGTPLSETPAYIVVIIMTTTLKIIKTATIVKKIVTIMIKRFSSLWYMAELYANNGHFKAASVTLSVCACVCFLCRFQAQFEF